MTTQLARFSESHGEPARLLYQPEFISEDEEKELIGRISALSLSPFQFGAFEGKRRVASFGWRYSYTSHSLEKADEIPGWIAPIRARVESFADLPDGAVKQLLVTEYDVGVGIGWHRDKPHFDKVFGLSLLSPCKFRFRRKIGTKWQRITVNAEPGSLYMMAGESRSIWEHSIPPVDAMRYSITFRTMARPS